MSETGSHPFVLLLVPPQHEVDPESLRDLRRAVGDEYGAELLVRQLGFPAPVCRLHLIGEWGSHTEREVWESLSHFIEASFYTLDWLEEAG